jgi:spore coat protein A
MRKSTPIMVLALLPAMLLFQIIAIPGQAQNALPLNPLTLTKYIDPLPIPGVMQPVTPGGTYYEVGAYQITQQLHSQLPPTTVWGYGTSMATAGYPAATFEATRGVPIQVKWTNNLVDGLGNPLYHPLTVDQTLHWADPLGTGHSMDPYAGPVPLVTHLHGGETEPMSDGHPDSWFTPGFAMKGPGWVHEVFTYHNEQPPATIWYHDHALGITRLNVYMGLAGFYLIRDPGNEPQNLPSGQYEIPVVIQDRIFDVNGQLFYPNVGINMEHPYWVPEFFGNVIVVNGKVWPYLNVEPRKYRFRFLNGSDARFYGLKLLDAAGNPGPAFTQIGSDGGYLRNPVTLNDPLNLLAPRLLMAPGERADIVIDFSAYAPGTIFTLNNNAKAPFPKGAPVDPQTTAQIMQFRVVAGTPDNLTIPQTLNTIPVLVPNATTRTLTLNEVMGMGGPLAMFLDGKMWDTGVTEMPVVGSTEIWEIVNLTADTHPIHLHLVQFQMLNRQKFQVSKYLRAYNALNPVIPAEVTYNPPVAKYLAGQPMPPDPNESGWKDTFRMNPGEITRVLVRFAPIGSASVTPYPFDATAEPGYVWHCHIISHEDNEMMRPYKLVNAPTVALETSSAARAVSSGGDVPKSYALGQNYPNPFNPTTAMSFALPRAGNVELMVYNVRGEEVRTLANGMYAAGKHTIAWDGRDNSGKSVASGIYFSRLRAGDFQQVRKMVLLR